MKLRAAGAALVLATAVLLGGCADFGTEQVREERTQQGDFFEKDVTLQDGTVLHCLFWSPTNHQGGVWCQEPKKGDND